MVCYVCSSGKPFLTAPIRVNDSFLTVPGAFFHLWFCLLLGHSSQAILPSKAYISLALLLMTSLRTGSFSFVFVSSSASSGVWRHHRGSLHACCIELTGATLRDPLIRAWCLMGFPQSEAHSHQVPPWFSRCFQPCRCVCALEGC